MPKLRTVFSAVFALVVVAAVVAPPPVSAATTGVGTASASTSLLNVALGTAGSVLQVRVLGDDSRSSIDPTVGAPSASSALVPVAVTSAAVPALNVTAPTIESKSTGAQDVKSSPTVDLTTAATSGSLNPFSLTSIVDTAGARTGFDTSATNVAVAGGLLSVPSAVSSLAANATSVASTGVRGVEVPAITVLDLSALLDGLGLDLDDLPLATVVALLNQLGLEVAGVGSGTDLNATVDEINAAIDEVQALLDGGTTTVDDVLDILDPLGPIVDTDPVTDLSDDAIAAANAAIDELQATLTTVLDAALAALDGAALLKVDGLEVGINATAVDTVANSSAAVAAKVGSVSVGGITLPGIDLLAAADQVNALASSVTGTVGSTLAVVHPGLADLVKVTLFDRATEVKGDANYVTSTASLAALVVALTPPADLTSLVDGIKAQVGVDELLAGLSAAAADATAMATLESALGGVQALAGGATVRVLDMSATATFAPQGGVVAPAPAPGAPGSELPRTGGPGLPLAVLGIALLGGFLAVQRSLRIHRSTTS